MGSSKDKQKNVFHTDGFPTAEKKQRNLEAEKQSIENSLLLMKGTSDNAGSSKENIELLEKKLEEITKELRISRKEAVNGRGKQPLRIMQDRRSDMQSLEKKC